jgi:hypothetical protein
MRERLSGLWKVINFLHALENHYRAKSSESPVEVLLNSGNS